MANPITFLKETKTEMKLVKWPARSKAFIYAVIIIGFSLGLGYALGGFDTFFHAILRTLIIK